MFIKLFLCRKLGILLQQTMEAATTCCCHRDPLGLLGLLLQELKLCTDDATKAPYSNPKGPSTQLSYTLKDSNLHTYYPKPEYLIIGSFGPLG